ncbi:MAG: hypothetical protein ACT4PT_10535 [Methanobacteriota archaeon]
MRGEVVYQFVFDAGGRIDVDKIGRVLEESPLFADVDVEKAAPPYISLPRPLTVRFEPVHLATSAGPLTIGVVAKLFDIGAVSITLRAPVEGNDIPDLVRYFQPRVRAAEGEIRLDQYAQALYFRIIESIRGALVEPYGVYPEPEGYTVFCLTEPPVPAAKLFDARANEIAALLSNEPDADRLSHEEVQDNLRHWFSYYGDELVVVDWDAALLVDPDAKYEDVLFVVEIANLQLLELRTYDIYLDRILERSYLELERVFGRGALFAAPQKVYKEISEARVDFARVKDALDNITKFFGDYYLAKLYKGLSTRFHMAEWEASLDEKLGTLSALYAIAAEEVQNRRALILEASIVLLFVLDLVALFFFARG